MDRKRYVFCRQNDLQTQSIVFKNICIKTQCSALVGFVIILLTSTVLATYHYLVIPKCHLSYTRKHLSFKIPKYGLNYILMEFTPW